MVGLLTSQRMGTLLCVSPVTGHFDKQSTSEVKKQTMWQKIKEKFLYFWQWIKNFWQLFKKRMRKDFKACEFDTSGLSSTAVVNHVLNEATSFFIGGLRSKALASPRTPPLVKDVGRFFTNPYTDCFPESEFRKANLVRAGVICLKSYCSHLLFGERLRPLSFNFSL